MTAWLVAALLFVLAVPFHPDWLDFEAARRGVLGASVGIACFVPGVLPRELPVVMRALGAFGVFALLRSFAVTNVGYALEATSHVLALTLLVWAATKLTPRAVLRATLPASAIVAAVGLAQSCGVLLVAGSPEPVSTLGNRNVAAEVLAIGGAAAVLLRSLPAATRRDHALGTIVFLLCAAAIMTNGSRSGLVALPLGCLACARVGRRWQWLPIAVAVLVPVIGSVQWTSAEPASQTATAGVQPRARETFAVRVELAKGAAEMIAAAPVLGFGGGQFQIEYPFYRTEREIELSSYGRRFETAPKTVHNDYLQVLVEYGALGFLLLAGAAFALVRSVPLGMLGPVIAVLALALVRSPLGNAPAAAIICLLVGSCAEPQGPRLALAPNLHRISAWLLGLFLLATSLLLLHNQFAATGYVGQMRIFDNQLTRANADWQKARASIDAALAYRSYDHVMLIERAKDGLKEQATLADARRDIERLLELAPQLPAVQVHHAELLNAEGDPTGALRVLNLLRLRPQDEEHRRAIQVSTLILVRNKNTPGALALLYGSRHDRTRASLAAVLEGLVAQARTPADRQLLRAERAFVAFVDELLAFRAEREALPKTKRLVRVLALNRDLRAFKQLADSLPAGEKDLRYLLLLASVMLESGDKDTAEGLAALVKQRTLTKAHRALLEPVLPPLLELPKWRAVLAE